MSPPRMQQLARVTQSLDEKRGPDVRYAINVPQRWLSEGATVLIEPPRLAACAACDGGGCGTCRFRGALALRAADSVVEPLTVHLAPNRADALQLIRLPDQGAEAWEEGHPRGCLLLEILPGEQPSVGVTLLATDVRVTAPEACSRHLLTVAVLLLIVGIVAHWAK